MLNDESGKKTIKNDPKNDSGQLKLTCQTRNLDHEIRITQYKTN
jgi:hypothetical protein